MDLKKIINEIKSVRIRGAENVAKAAVLALKETAKSSSAKTPVFLVHKLLSAKSALYSTRPTEPLLRNSLNYIFKNIDASTTHDVRESIIKRTDFVLEQLERSDEMIAEIGAHKIKDGMIVFTHSYSSTVDNIIKKAHSQGVDFEVRVTEARPLYQGRTTAKDLTNEGIRVTMFVDAAARLAMKNTDIYLSGADAVTSEGAVINKIGTELMMEAAKRNSVLCYVCTNSWKLDPRTQFGFDVEIEKRFSQEVWKNPPRGVKISNFAFEKCNPNIIDGIISELGVFKPATFVEEARNRYRDFFD